MDVASENAGRRDVLKFTESTMKTKALEVLRDEIEKLGSVKASFGLEVKFKRETQNECGEMEEEKHRHFFKEDPHVLTKENLVEYFNEKFEEFVDTIKGKIENWSERESGWAVDEITIAYVNVARNEPLRGGIYIPLPKKLANKKAIINVKNRDNECLKWALKSALFPVEIHPERTSKYPESDGINWNRIDSPTRLTSLRNKIGTL